jgi:LysM repeat protein
MPEIPPHKLEVPKSTLPKIKVNLGSTKIKLRRAEALSANVLATITAIQQDTAGKRPKIELAKVQNLKNQWKFAEADRVALAQQVKNFEQQLRATATEDISRQTIIDLEKSIEIKAADQEKILKGAAERLGFDANATDLTPEEKAALTDTTTEKTRLEKYANNAIANHHALQDAQRKGSVSFNYKIAKGDTLGELAKRYNTTVEALVAANKSAVISTDPQHLKYGWITAGEKLVIPIESKVALLQPGKVWTLSQVKNMLTREQLANVSPGDKVWVNEAGDLVASPEVGDPEAKFVDARRTSAEVVDAATKKKSTRITDPGGLPRKFTKKYGWHKDAYIVQITDKNGNPRFMLQVDGKPWTRQKGGRPLFISAGQQAELYNIFTKMNKPPGIISKTLGLLAKSVTVPGKYVLTGTTRLMNMSGRVALGAVGLGSFKADIISTIAMITAMEYGTGRLLRNSAREQDQMRVADINAIAAKMVKHSDEKITLEEARKSVEELNLSENP